VEFDAREEPRRPKAINLKLSEKSAPPLNSFSLSKGLKTFAWCTVVRGKMVYPLSRAKSAPKCSRFYTSHILYPFLIRLLPQIPYIRR